MAQENVVLQATDRSDFGKGSARRLRREGFVPAVVCAKGKPTATVAVSPKQTARILHGPTKRNVLIQLHIRDQPQGQEQKRAVMVRDLQVDPVRRSLTHVDFIEVNPAQEVSVPVPLHLVGRSKQVIAGAKLRQLQRCVSVFCLPGNAPAHVELDITDLPLGKTPAEAIPLPEGARLSCDPQLSVASLVAGGRDQSADEEEAPKKT